MIYIAKYYRYHDFNAETSLKGSLNASTFYTRNVPVSREYKYSRN